ncbi:NmrA domain-containing protein [Mycena chlorophos]|uniref:NmrA domain-containing protein n=1 Tax=Mycena chlorophos TaxID=658473 RepID=A0A8H6SB73_MYCCL|nr:NmrA domain-containing protein [Mycena chlorophos]
MTVSTSPSAPLVVIVGITGNQGGSVATALIESDKPYRLRGLTRDVSRPAAQAYAAKGVELVSVAISVGNEDGVKKAFEGAEIVFAVTNFEEHISAEREIAEGKLMVDAAASIPTLKLFIWSALESFAELTSGQVAGCAFFDAKAAVTAHAKSIPNFPLSVVQAGYYATNIFKSVPFALRPDGSGGYTFSLPLSGSATVPLFDTAHDYGLYVRAAIELPQFGAGSEVLSGTHISYDDIIKELAAVTGKKIVFKPSTQPEFRAVFPFKPMADMVGEMFRGYDSCGYYGPKPVTSPDLLARKPRTWREYLDVLGKEEVLKRLGI